MIIECNFCEVKVFGKLIAEHESFDESDPSTFHAQLLECPRCNNTLLGGFYEHEAPVNELSRLWPMQETYVHYQIPDICSVSIVEAKLCYKAKAYSATAVMCGRALEGICKHHQTNARDLFNGIKELREQGIIDERIYLWAEQLRRHRNIGAHASAEKVTREDARDLLDFVNAICEYVFVLSEKFNEFISRKPKDESEREVPIQTTETGKSQI